MKTAEIQTLDMTNEVHLCDSCHEELPGCDQGKHIVYGTGKGTDNIVACSSYSPVHIRNYDEERDLTIKQQLDIGHM